MIKAVIFDIYGVLHPDTFWGLADVFIPDRGPEQRQAMRDLITRTDLGHMSRDEFWAEAAKEFGTDLETLMTEKEKLGGIDANLMKLILQLKAGGYKTGIISNVGVGFVDVLFADYSQEEYFDASILSGREGFMKPDPRIFTKAAEQLEVELDECIFFDDVQRNVEGAQATGMQAELYEGIASCKAALIGAGIEF